MLKENINQESFGNFNKSNSTLVKALGADSLADEQFVPNEDFLNDLLLPDTRIFASLLNKDARDSINTLNTGSGHKGGSLTDLTFKTVLIGNCEHIILDNLNNLSDFRGDFSKLQNLARAVANKFNKPVTIPAFFMIDDKPAVAKVKENLKEKNIYPIVIETNSSHSMNNETSANLTGANILANNNILFHGQESQQVYSSNIVEVKQENVSMDNALKQNSQNHYLIQSLQSESKLNQQLKENQMGENMGASFQVTNNNNSFGNADPLNLNVPNQLPVQGSNTNSINNNNNNNVKLKKVLVKKTPRKRRTIAASCATVASTLAANAAMAKEKINQLIMNETEHVLASPSSKHFNFMVYKKVLGMYFNAVLITLKVDK